MKLPKFLLNQKILNFPLRKFKVYGKSMNPTFPEGTFVFAWTWFNHLKKEDVVVAKKKELLVLKRVKEIRDGKYFLIGDNYKESTDSRSFGFVEKKDILGKVLFRIT